MSRVGGLWKSSLLSEGLRLPEKQPLEDFSNKECCHVGIMSIFPFMLEGIHWKNLGRSVNLGR